MTSSTFSSWVTYLASDQLIVAGASLSSILSLVITLLIFSKLLRINSQLVLRARQTRWLRSLRDYATELSRLLKSEEGAEDEIREILAKCRPTLRALNKCFPIWSAKRLKMVLLLSKVGKLLGDGALRWLMITSARDGLARKIYEGLLELNESLKEDIEQAKIYRAQV